MIGVLELMVDNLVLNMRTRGNSDGRLTASFSETYRMILLLLLLSFHPQRSSANWDSSTNWCSVPHQLKCECLVYTNEKLSIGCRDTGFKEIPSNFTKPTALELTRNELSIVHELTYPTLKHLRLERNSIEIIIDGAFKQLTDLTVLNLAHNNIKVLTQDTFRGLKGLELLNMEDNPIMQITHEAFTGNNLPSLQFLKLSKCHIRLIESGSFSGMRKLFQLNISSNHIRELGILGDESGLPSLADLDLSDNRLRSIHASSLQHLTSLTHLFLKQNHIVQLHPSSFPPSVKKTLKSLWLRQNRLYHVAPGALGQFETLTTLDIAFNSLKMLAAEEIPSTVDKILVHHNPWSCFYCVNRWLLLDAYVWDWNKDSDFTCAWPETLHGTNIYETSGFSNWTTNCIDDDDAEDTSTTSATRSVMGSISSIGIVATFALVLTLNFALLFVIFYRKFQSKSRFLTSKTPTSHVIGKSESRTYLISAHDV